MRETACLNVGRAAASPIALTGTLQDRDFLGRECVATRLVEAGQYVVDASILDGFLRTAILLGGTGLMLDEYAVVIVVARPINIEQVEAVGT